MCGKKVLIRHGDKETIAEVRDKCPGCKKGNTLYTFFTYIISNILVLLYGFSMLNI